MVVGYTSSFVILAVVVIPLGWQFFSRAAGQVFAGEQSSASHVLDASVILAITLGQLALAAILAVRRRTGRSGVTTTTGRHHAVSHHRHRR